MGANIFDKIKLFIGIVLISYLDPIFHVLRIFSDYILINKIQIEQQQIS